MRKFREASRRAAIASGSVSFTLAALALGGPVTATTAAAATATTTAEDQSVVKPKEDKKSDDTLTEIVVTGSRIARPDLERLEPTTIITSEFMDRRAYTNVIDALSELPSFGEPDNNRVGTQSSEGVGQSFANFFSLGSQRTLTLVDGRRFVPENTPSPFGPTGSGGEQVDLNVIPTQLIDRIETIAVGGAPVYGSDAIAGTVNIILKHDYEGVDIDAQGGTSGHGDASQSRVRALLGKNFDDGRGNITLNVEFANLGGLLGTQRERYTENLGFIEPTTPGPYQYTIAPHVEFGGITTSGVPMVDDGYLGFQPNLAILNNAGQPLAFNNGHLAPYNLGAFDATGTNTVGGDGVNGAATTTLLSPQQRINATSLGSFKINDNVRVFDELWFSETHTDFPVYQGAYDTGLFGYAGQPNGNLIIAANNPFLSAADQATIAQNLAAYAANPNNSQQTSQFYLARLNQDISAGGSTADQNTKRAVLGIDGTVPLWGHDFKYEVSGTYGQSSNFSVSPSVNFQNFQNALNAVVGPGGQIICAPGYTNSPAATESSTCAPFNPFGNHIASAAAFAYVTSLGTELSTLTQRDFNATLTGDLFALPAGPLKGSVGYENRRESSNYVPNEFFQLGAGYSVPLSPLEGAFMTNEVFGELLAPVIAPAQDVPFVHRLELEGAAREVDHSVAGKALTWTAGLRFEPVSVLQIRGNYTRAIRAPSVTEAYLPDTAAYESAADPCDQTLINSGPNPTLRAANCAKAGITQPFSSNILNVTEPISVTGNPGLKNEIADSRTFGVAVRPSERMSLSIDYVSIDISQAIVSLSATNVLDACYDSPGYPNKYCGQITRDSTGQITFVQTGYANAGYENFNGIQTEFDWSVDIPFASSPGALGTLDVRLNEFFMNQLVQQVDGSVTVLAGQLGNSKHKGVIDLTWHKNALFALWQAQFTGKAVWDNSLPANNSAINGVGGWWVHNLTIGDNVNSHLKLELVVDNVFDKQPPYPLPAVPPNSTGSSGIEAYFSGIMGRYFTAQAAYKF